MSFGSRGGAEPGSAEPVDGPPRRRARMASPPTSDRNMLAIQNVTEAIFEMLRTPPPGCLVLTLGNVNWLGPRFGPVRNICS